MEHYRQPQPHWLLNRSLHRRQDLSGMAVEGSIGGKVNRLSAPLRGTLKPHLPNRLGPPADDCKTTRQRLDLTCVEAIIWRHEHLRVNLVPRKLSDRVVEQRLGLGDAETAQLGVPARRGECGDRVRASRRTPARAPSDPASPPRSPPVDETRTPTETAALD